MHKNLNFLFAVLFFLFMPMGYCIVNTFSAMFSFGSKIFLYFLVSLSLVAPLVLNFKNILQLNSLQKIEKGSALTYIMIGWFLAGTFSFIANYSPDSKILINYIAAYLSPLIIYFYFIHFKLDEKQLIKMYIALALGSIVPLALGVINYYKNWGIPSDAHNLIYSHFDQIKMKDYMEATFGNTNNTAAFLVLITPSIYALLLFNQLSLTTKFIFLSALILAFVNLLIIESRAAIVIISSLILYLSYVKSKVFFIKCCAFFLIALALTTLVSKDFLQMFLDRIYMAITFSNTSIDISSHERLLAIYFGWELFIKHIFFGVGAGAEIFFNPMVTAHQFNISQATQTGILGFFTSILLCLTVFKNFFTFSLEAIRKINTIPFILVTGPTAYLLYGIIANITLNISIINTWIALMAAMLGLMNCKTKYWITS